MKILKPNNAFIPIALALVIALRPAPGKGNAAAPEIKLPAVTQFTTAHGLRAYCVSDELPRVSITAAIGFGSLYEERERAGISSVLARALSLGGSKKYPGNALHEAVEGIGGRLSIGSSWEETLVSVTVLERHADLAMDVVASLLAEPDITAQNLRDAQALVIEGIRRKKDQPHILAFEKLRELIFDGRGYGATETERSVQSITMADIERAIAAHFTAGNTIVAIASPGGVERARPLIERHAARLRKGERIYYPDYGEAARRSVREKSSTVYLLPRDIPQATVTIGTVAPSIFDGNVFPLTVMNYILGEGSFNSRLMQEIRVKRGLSYSAGSTIRFRKNTGLFISYAQTKTEMADTTLSLLKENILRMGEHPVTDDELKWARESISNSYIFGFDTTLSVLEKYLFLGYNGLDESYLRDYLPVIMATTQAEMRGSAAALFGQGMVTVVVGKRELAGRLARFGRVEIIEQESTR
jgi:zinc protease